MIILGSDHRGYLLKQEIKKFFNEENIITIDVGSYNRERSDYNDFVRLVNAKVLENESNVGVFFCGTAAGPSIAANRNPKMRAACCWSVETAKLAREKQDANMIIIPAECGVSKTKAIKMIKTFLTTDFLGGTYADRVKELTEGKF